MAETEETPNPAENTGGKAAQNQGGAGVSKDARTFGMLCHLLGLFTSFIGPLIIWLLKKEEDPFIDDQGKEALNFQITVVIAWVGALVVPSLLRFLICMMPLLTAAVGVADLVFCIIACVKSNNGEAYKYPVSIRLIK